MAAVQGVSLQVCPGEFVMITGRSGSGKTTLLNLMAGLANPTSGKVVWEGVDLWSLPDSEQSRLRNTKIGFVFQFPSLLPSLNALENISMPVTFNQNGAGEGIGWRALELLDMVGLADKCYAYPSQLSAGQQQRLVVARSLLLQPAVLLADEPTSNLDDATEKEIMQLFCRVHEQTDVTIVMVTHTTQLIHYGSRSLEMVAGKILGSG